MEKSSASWCLVCIIVTLVVTLYTGAPALYAQRPAGDAEAGISIQNEAFELPQRAGSQSLPVHQQDYVSDSVILNVVAEIHTIYLPVIVHQGLGIRS